MGNTKGREQNNKDGLIKTLELAHRDGRLYKTIIQINNEDKDVYLLIDGGIPKVIMDVDKGNFLFTTAGRNKSNKRQYINIAIPGNTKYMCSNYNFRVICDGLFGTQEEKERYKLYRENIESYGIIKRTRDDVIRGPIIEYTEVNHINGDTEDNKSDNLEVDTHGMNATHARLMSEVAYYFPDIINTAVDCQGHKMHSWKDKIGVSCQQIRDWNKKHPSDAIKAWKDKKGEFTSHLTKDQVIDLLKYFNKIF